MNGSIDGRTTMVDIDSDSPIGGQVDLLRDPSRFNRENFVSRCHHPLPNSSIPPRQSFHDHNSPGERSIGSVRLMNCFNTPSQRTVFGRKKSEHWDSFQRKYSSPSYSEKRAHIAREKTTLYNLQNFHNEDHNPSRQGRGTKGRSQTNKKKKKKRLPCGLLGCILPGEDDYNDDEARRTKQIPLVERYSKYFERRSARNSDRG